MRIFTSAERPLKINLHMHTTMSDGKLLPLDALRAYEAAGYDAAAITDHRVLTRVPGYQGGMVLLSGMEWDLKLPRDRETVHLLGIGMGEGFDYAPDETGGAQGFIDAVRRAGGLCYLCHPHWSLNRVETIAGLRGLAGAEMYNAVSRPPYNPDRADASNVLDLAATEGCLLPTIAADDTHHYRDELFGGFIYLNAQKTRGSVMAALSAGDYHASQGPRILSADYEDGVVRVRTSPVSCITFQSNRAWSPRRSVTGEGITEASYRVQRERGERFIRVTAIDRGGKKAWLHPFAL